MSPLPPPVTTKDLDCFECKIITSATSFVMGGYLYYVAKNGQFQRGKNLYRYFLKSVGCGLIYLAGARWTYLPPFHNIKVKKV